MSSPLYNPFASGTQRSTQGQYGLTGTQAGMDPLGAASHLSPGSSLRSSGLSPGTSTNPRGILPSMLPQTMSYGLGQNRPTHTTDMESVIDMHIRGAREEVRLLNQRTQQQQDTDWDSHLTSTSRDEMLPRGAGYNSYPTSSASSSVGRLSGLSDEQSGSGNSMDWLTRYQTPTTAPSANLYSRSSSSTTQNMSLSHSSQSSQLFQTASYPAAGDSCSSIPIERVSSKSRLGEYSMHDHPSPSMAANRNRPKYTSESATNILKKFGLENEDLELLTDYPDSELTPENLPFILRDIRLRKAKRAMPASVLDVDLRPTAGGTASGSDHFGVSEAGLRRQEDLTGVLRPPNKVIDYGHSSKYTGGFGDDISGRGSSFGSSSGGTGSRLIMESYSGSSHSREPLPEDFGTVKYGGASSSRDQAGSVSSSTLSYGSVLTSVPSQSLDPPKQLQRSEQTNIDPLKRSQRPEHPFLEPPQRPQRPEHTSLDPLKISQRPVQTTLDPLEKTQRQEQTSVDPPDRLQRPDQTRKPIKILISLPKKDNDPILDSKAPKPIPVREPGRQGSTTTLIRGVNPNRQGLVVLGSKEDNVTLSQGKTEGQVAAGQGQNVGYPVYMKQPQTPMWLPEFPLMNKNVPPPPFHIPGISSAVPGVSGSPLQIMPGGPPPMVPGQMPPTRPPPLHGTMIHPPPLIPPPMKMVAKALPTPTMMSDYSATMPRIFPHTCSLCNIECVQMKDWIAHQNSSHHIESCRLLRKRYPDWKGETTPVHSVVSRDIQPSASTSLSSQSLTHRRQATSGGRSRSPSPRRRQATSGGRSRSLSPRRRQATSGGRSRSPSPRRRQPNIGGRSRSPSPRRRQAASGGRSRSPSPRRRQAASGGRSRSPSPRRRQPASGGRSRSPSPCRRQAASGGRSRSPSPRRRQAASGGRSRSPSPRRYYGKTLSGSARESHRARSRSPRSSRHVRRSRSYSRSPHRSPPSSLSSHRRRSRSRSYERRSPPKSSSRRQSDTSAERLAKKLLETSGVQSMSGHSRLEAMVQSLAPALLAELAKMKSSSSSPSSSSSKGAKRSSSPSKGRKRSSSSPLSTLSKKSKSSKSSASKTSSAINESSSASNSKSSKRSKYPAGTMITLKGVPRHITRAEIVDALKRFGKPIAVFRVHTSEELVKIIFEKVGEAMALANCKDFSIQGIPISVFTHKDVVTKKPLLPTPKTKPLMDIPDVTKVCRTTSKAKVLVSKAKSKTTKPQVKTLVKKKAASKSLVSTAKTVKIVKKTKPKQTETKCQQSVAAQPKAIQKVGEKRRAAKTLVPKAKATSKTVKKSNLRQIEIKTEDTEESVTTQPKGTDDGAEDIKTTEEKLTKTTAPKESVAEHDDTCVTMTMESPCISVPESEVAVVLEEPEPSEMEQTSKEESELQHVEITPETPANPSSEAQPEPSDCQHSLSENLPNMEDVPPVSRDCTPVSKDVSDGSPLKVEEATAKTEAILPFLEDAVESPQITSESLEKPVESEETAVKCLETSIQTSEPVVPLSAAQAPQPDLRSMELTIQGLEMSLKSLQTPTVAPVLQPEAVPEDSATPVGGVILDASKTETLEKTESTSQQVAVMTAGAVVRSCFRYPESKTLVSLNRSQILRHFQLRHLSTIVMITDLPHWRPNDGYSRQDFINRLASFGYCYKENSLYILPYQRMAFVLGTVWSQLDDLTKQLGNYPIRFRGSVLTFHIVMEPLILSPREAYESLMSLGPKPLVNQETLMERLVCFSSVEDDPKLTEELWEAVRTTACVRNYLPLIDREYFEFETTEDVDAVDLWFEGSSLFSKFSFHRFTADGPVDATVANKKAISTVAALPTVPSRCPGSSPPYWRFTTMSPFCLPTVIPQFRIPLILTPSGLDRTEVITRYIYGVAPLQNVAMVTGLPEDGCRVEDITNLALPWGYVPGRFNVFVLPFQRRAFVKFPTWYTCCDFVMAHTEQPVKVKGSQLTFHFVLEPILSDNHIDEDQWYRSLMDLNNKPCPSHKALENRLVIVELNYYSVEIIKTLLCFVNKIGSAAVSNCIPLADRVYIETSPKRVHSLCSRFNVPLPLCTRNEVLRLNLVRRPGIFEGIGKFQSVKMVKRRKDLLNGEAVNPGHMSPSLKLHKLLKLQYLTGALPSPSFGTDSDRPMAEDQPGTTKEVREEIKDETKEGDEEEMKPTGGEFGSITRGSGFIHKEDALMERGEETGVGEKDRMEPDSFYGFFSPPLAPNMPGPSSASAVMLAPKPSDGPSNLPPMSQEVFRILEESIRQHRLAQQNQKKEGSMSRGRHGERLSPERCDSSRYCRSSRAHSEEELQSPSSPTSARTTSPGSSSSSRRSRRDQSPLAKRGRRHEDTRESHTSTRKSKNQDSDYWKPRGEPYEAEDFTKDALSADAYEFDLGEFNLEEFVTVDEIGEVGDKSSPSRPHKSSSSSNSRRSVKTSSTSDSSSKRKKTEERSSSSSAVKQSSKEPSKESMKTRSSSTSLSSSSTKKVEQSQDLSKKVSSPSPSSSKGSSKTVPSATTTSSVSSSGVIGTSSLLTPPTDTLPEKKNDPNTEESQTDRQTEEKQINKSSLGTLDEVSEEEEDYPDDAEEKEDLRKRQTQSSSIQEAPQKNNVKTASKTSAKKSQLVKTTTQRRTTRSSAAAAASVDSTTKTATRKETENMVFSQSIDVVAEQGVVARSDHQMSLEAPVMQTAASETEMEISVTQQTENQGAGVGNESHNDSPSLSNDDHSGGLPNLQPSGTEGTLETEHKKSTEEGKENGDEKPEDEEENYEILDSLDDHEGAVTKDGCLVEQDAGSEKQQAEVQEDQTPHQKTYQILDSTDAEGKPDIQVEIEESFQVLDSVEEETEMEGEGQPDEDKKITKKRLSEGDSYQLKDGLCEEDSDDKNKEIPKENRFQGSDIGDQTQMGSKENHSKITSAHTLPDGSQAAKDNLQNQGNKYSDKDTLQIPQPGGDKNSIHTIENQDNQILEEEIFQILDSVEDDTAMEDDSQKLGSTQMPKAPSGQLDEEDYPRMHEENTYKIIDSVEDQSAAEKDDKIPEKDDKTLTKDDSLTKTRAITTRASKIQKKESAPKRGIKTLNKLDRKDSNSNTRTGVSGKEVDKGTYKVVDSLEDEMISGDFSTIQGTTIKEKTPRKDDKVATKEDRVTRKTSTPVNVTEEGRRTRSQRKEEKTIKVDDKSEKQSGIRTRTTKKEEETFSFQIVDCVEGEATLKPPEMGVDNATKKYGRNIKKEDKSVKKARASKEAAELEGEEEAAYQVVDSVEGEAMEDHLTAAEASGGEKEARTAKDKAVRKDTEPLNRSYTPNKGCVVGKKGTMQRKEDGTEEGGAMDTFASKEMVHEEAPTTYHVIDSLEDQPIYIDQTTIEKSEIEEKNPKNRDTSIRDSDARRRELAPGKEDCTNKKDGRPTRKSRTTTKELEELESSYQIVDSVYDEPIEDSPIAGKGTGDRTPKKEFETSQRDDQLVKKIIASNSKLEDEVEDSFQIIDSVEDEVTDNLPATVDSLNQEKINKTTRKEDQTGESGNKATKRSRTTTEVSEEMLDSYQIVDSVEDEPTGDFLATPDKLGRNEWQCTSEKPTEKARTAIELPERLEDSFQILDAVKDEPTGDFKNRTRRSRAGDRVSGKDGTPRKKSETTALALELNEEEELYQIVDSVEDEPTNVSLKEEEIPKDDEKPTKKNDAIAEAFADKSIGKITQRKSDACDKGEASTKSISPAKEPDNEKKFYTTIDERKTQKKDKKVMNTSSLVTLDEVSEEEEDYPVDSEEEEAFGKQQAMASAAQEVPEKGGATAGNKTPAKQSQQVKSRCMTRSSMAATRKATQEGRDSRLAKESSTTMKFSSFQVLDSVEDESAGKSDSTNNEKSEETCTIEDRKPEMEDKLAKLCKITTAASEMEEEEEMMYQVLDSVEDELISDSVMDAKIHKSNDMSDATARATADKIVDKTPQKSDETSNKQESLSEINNTPAEEPENDTIYSLTTEEIPMEKKKEQLTNISSLVNLDEVSEEEEDYPDDTKEEEELRKRQDARKQLMKKREKERDRSTKDREEGQREWWRVSCREGGGREGGKDGGRDTEEDKVDTEGLVTLDEVGADEPGDWEGVDSDEVERSQGEEDLRTLVTLDEIVEEKEGEEPSLSEPLPHSQEDDNFRNTFNPETLVTLDEAGGDEEEETKEEEKNTSSASRHKLTSGHLEERMDFVTVDEVGEDEEEKDITTRREQSLWKRGRQTPVRKSARGKQDTRKEEKDEKEEEPLTEMASPTDLLVPPSLDDTSLKLVEDRPVQSIDDQPKLQNQEARQGETLPSLDASSTGQHQPPQLADVKTTDAAMVTEDKMGRTEPRASLKDLSRQRREAVEPEAKRSRSQSPTLPADYKMPPFRPNNPIGVEFVVPKTGFFCSLCSIFYENERSAKKLHCSSQKHYQNMEKHFKKLKEQTRRTTESSSQSPIPK